MPIRARSAAPPASAVLVPYSTRPSEGASSVPRMASSVDLPAPFGPSSPTMSPRVTGERDLRQRLAAAVVTGQGGDREALEVADHAAAPWPPPGASSSAASTRSSSVDERRPALAVLGPSACRRDGAPRWPPARASGGPAPPRSIVRSGRRAGEKATIQARQDDEPRRAPTASPARGHVVGRHVRDLHHELIASSEAAAAAQEEHLAAFGVEVLHAGQLRGLQSHVAHLLDRDERPLEGRRPTLPPRVA